MDSGPSTLSRPARRGWAGARTRRHPPRPVGGRDDHQPRSPVLNPPTAGRRRARSGRAGPRPARTGPAPQPGDQGGHVRRDGTRGTGHRRPDRVPPAGGRRRGGHDDGRLPGGGSRGPHPSPVHPPARRSRARPGPTGRRRPCGGGGRGRPGGPRRSGGQPDLEPPAGPGSISLVQPARLPHEPGAGRRRHRPDHRRLRTGRPAGDRCRVRQHRGPPRPQLPAERLPQPEAEPAP